MRNYDYGYGFKPITGWGYVGYSILWAIPVVGWLICLFTAIGSKHRNVRNFARSIFCRIFLLIILAAAAVGTVVLLDVLNVIEPATIFSYVKDFIKMCWGYVKGLLSFLK